jgi:radical SAM family protein/B12 binding protein
MNVVFVDNLLFEDTEGINRYVLQPHLGLISLISMLEQNGHTGVLLDPKIEVAQGKWRLDDTLYRKIAARVLSHNPDVVGMTSLGCNFICTVKVASYIKEARPDLPILLGGPHATVLDKTILARFTQFDAIARNEAERTIVPLVEEIAAGRLWKIPGITFRTNGTVWENAGSPTIDELDELPLAAYHAYPIRELGLKSIRVDAGRGCPFQCTFCSTATFFGRKYRLKSAGRLVGELDFLNREYGVSEFALSHDLFTVNKHKVREFCDAVESRAYTWKCSARMDCVDPGLLERMYAAGCRSIYYGIEAGSSRMQRIAKKHLDLGIFAPTLDTTQDLGMSATVSFITGYPEETLIDQAATLDLMASCFESDRRRSPLNVQLHLLTPEPGTELLNVNADSLAYDGHVSDFNFPSLEKTDAMVIETNPQIFINHHYFLSLLPRSRHIFVTELYQTLYGLGYPLLNHLIRCLDQTFSATMDAMYQWKLSSGWNGPLNGSFLNGFLAARLGTKHYLSGLLRYMILASDLRRSAAHSPTEFEPKTQADSFYRLSDLSRVALGVPDCPRLLDHLVSLPNSSVPKTLLSSRHNFLLVLRPEEPDVVNNYSLSSAAAATLMWFEQPRSIHGLEGEFSRQTGFPLPPSHFLNDLVSSGFLEAAGSV